MKRFLLAVVIGAAAAYVLVRFSHRRLLSEQLSDEDDIEESFESATAP